MLARNTNCDDLREALHIVNEKYQGNIEFNRFEKTGKDSVRFTLRVKQASHKVLDHVGPRGGKHYRIEGMLGARVAQGSLMCGFDGKPYIPYIKHLHYACWHVHGDFFEALFSFNPSAIIAQSKLVDKITSEEGNWQDRNIGSRMYPIMYSEACECEA